MSQFDNSSTIDVSKLKTQVDADISARLLEEADAAHYINRRGFRVGELTLLVKLDVTSEVAEMPPICRLPGAPHGVKGLVNRHGRVMPVMDLALLFGFKNTPSNRPWLLVCGRGDAAVGLFIDGLPERKSFAQTDEIDLREVTSPMSPYAKAAYRQDKEIWIDIDSEAFFSAVFKVDAVQVSRP